MRFYLSSFKLGNRADALASMYGSGKAGYVANALDHVTDDTWLKDWIRADIDQLAKIGVQAIRFDLRDFFAADTDVETAVSELSGLWISGGNVFVLRQAMKLSGLDTFLLSDGVPGGFVYGGYSAACCVLSSSLRPYAIVDDPDVHPYKESSQTIWDGLGILDFAYMPHFQSKHTESALIDMEIEYCHQHDIPYKAFRDGEVLIKREI